MYVLYDRQYFSEYSTKQIKILGERKKKKLSSSILQVRIQVQVGMKVSRVVFPSMEQSYKFGTCTSHLTALAPSSAKLVSIGEIMKSSSKLFSVIFN